MNRLSSAIRGIIMFLAGALAQYFAFKFIGGDFLLPRIYGKIRLSFLMQYLLEISLCLAILLVFSWFLRRIYPDKALSTGMWAIFFLQVGEVTALIALTLLGF